MVAAANVAFARFSLGGGLMRNDVHAGAGRRGCRLHDERGVSGRRRPADGHPHARSTTRCRTAPATQIYKGILAGKRRAVFNGRIVVRPDAQKTDAKQTNRALLLSDEAQINSNPQLEIFADDVKCTHGATVGQLDAEAMFYLRPAG